MHLRPSSPAVPVPSPSPSPSPSPPGTPPPSSLSDLLPGAAARKRRGRPGLLARADLLDRAAYLWVAARPSPVLDRVLPPLSRSANHGGLWAAVALALAAPGRPRLRRAALRGGFALALASPSANLLGKGLVRRRRPVHDAVPFVRHLRRFPQTSSFPSGHSASAAAFAVGVALESRVAAVPVGLLAAVVAYSRVHVGVHYPGDVLAGVALGAVAAGATARVWPTRPQEAARAVPASAEAPALPEGEGLVLVVNPRSGGGHAADLVPTLAEALPRARIVELGADDDVQEVLEKASEGAVALGIAGGDGTVQCAAETALRHDLPLVVIPGGTLNHFAADVGLVTVADTVRAVVEGTAVRVDVGTVDGGAEPDGLFLNTASIGGYPEMVVARERLEHRLGKWPALIVALVQELRRDPPVEVSVDGEHRRLWLLFAGQGVYYPAGFAPAYRPRLDEGLLDLRLVDATTPLARTRLVAAVLLGRLGRSRVYEARTAQQVTITSRGPGLRLARDGEVEAGTRDTITLRVRRAALIVYQPREAERP